MFLFDNFRHIAKVMAKEKNLTYAQIASMSGLEESTIKCFMCGANDSRRVAEKIADALGMSLIYSNGRYELTNKEDTSV